MVNTTEVMKLRLEIELLEARRNKLDYERAEWEDKVNAMEIVRDTTNPEYDEAVMNLIAVSGDVAIMNEKIRTLQSERALMIKEIQMNEVGKDEK